MGSGFFAGILWGGLVAVVALALSSQLTEYRDLERSAPQATALEVPGGSEFNQARPETDPVVPEPEAPPARAAEAPGVGAPEDVAAAPPLADTAPATAPATVVDAPAPGAGPEAPDDVSVEVSSADGRPATDAVAPAVPEAEVPSAPSIVVEAPQATVPTAPAEVLQPVPPGEEEAGDVAVASAPEPDAPPSSPEAMPSPGPAPVVTVDAVTPPPAPDAADTGLALSEVRDSAPGEELAARLPSPEADAAPAGAVGAPAAPSPVQATPDTPRALPAPEAGGLAPSDTGLPRPGFSNATGVRVNRLPTIGGGAASPGAPEPEVEREQAVLPDDAPALLRYAVPFENPEGRPLLAIVLLHDDPGPAGETTGRDLPLPVSFAVDGGLANARDVAAAYRAAGREILLVPTLPPGAAPSDVEVALAVNFDTIPEAVALMDSPGAGFQSEREAVAQVVNAVSATGHGLVTFPRGLNTAQQLAERAGVPSRLVFRVLDDSDPGSVLRTLDQAAFRARQEGVVILVGRARPATVEALRSWSTTTAATQVALAPMSAALTPE